MKKAIGTVFQGAAWQRCRVHFMRNVLAVVPKGSQDMVASIIRTVFAQPDREHIHTQFAEVTTMLGRSHPKVAAMLGDAEHDLLAFASFPQRHWRQIWFTNPLERVNKEIKRRTDVVGVFPNSAALLRLAGAVLVEQHDEWEAGDRRCRGGDNAARTHGSLSFITDLDRKSESTPLEGTSPAIYRAG